MAQIVNRKQAASYCGVSLPTFDVWIQRGCPFVRRGSKGKEWKFDLGAVTAWRDRYCAKPREVVAHGTVMELDTAEQAAVIRAVGHLIAQVGTIAVDAAMEAGASIETAYVLEQTVTTRLGDAAEAHLASAKIQPVDLVETFCAAGMEVDFGALAAAHGKSFDEDACEAYLHAHTRGQA
ncbi:terminase small subunit [Methylobacterium sp. J-090]|uniref:terminase small subunit n=1 Tax=Methylobacterium sp. J-090 TaxID=2836666 RepID=UPI001FB8A520|nr:terminase small subunit [Methylobacterium sp. J-090]MCJ2082765.1 terminase small subunit [Methylobacterium sp. J-090]